MSQTSVRDLSAMLARDAEGVARHLLGTSGKREGQELRFGDIGVVAKVAVKLIELVKFVRVERVHLFGGITVKSA